MTTASTPRISVIMIDGSFREYFHAIRYFGDQTLPPDDYELIWVEYYETVKPELRAEIERFKNFRIITLNRTDIYHPSYCFNAGVMAARSDLIAIPDADVVVEREFLAQIWEAHQACDELVMYIHRRNVFKDDHIPNWDLDHLRQFSQISNPQNHGGCITVRKKWLLAINGYDQHPIFAGHMHGNDYDVYSRLKTLGLYVKWHPDIKMYHPWHPGTAVPSPIYAIHRFLAHYHARHENPLAFQGIDPASHYDIPPDALAQIEQIKVDFARQTQSQSGRIRQLLRRVRGKLLQVWRA